jgi:hypothetical protein
MLEFVLAFAYPVCTPPLRLTTRHHGAAVMSRSRAMTVHLIRVSIETSRSH